MQYMMQSHFPRPLNREHFLQLCHSLVNEHWHTSFDFNPRSIQRSENVRLLTYLKDTDCVIAINCQWHGKDSPSPTINQINDAVAAAQFFHERINLLLVLVPGVAPVHLSEHIAKINDKNRLNGQFTIQVWCWDDIEEKLNTCKQVAGKYLANGLAMNPHWFAGAFEDSHKALRPVRLPHGKLDRNKPVVGGKANAVFDRSVTDAFEQYIHATQHKENSRYLKVTNAVNMGHAVALIHDGSNIEIWLLTPELRDTEFRADTERWVLCVMTNTVKHAFAHVLFKDYPKKDTISLSIRFVHLKPTTNEGGLVFTPHTIIVKRTWRDFYPREPLKVKRYLLAEAMIDDDKVTVTQHVFAFGWALIHTYKFPLASVSYKIVRQALVNRFYPRAVPHSHRVLLEGEQTYWRPIEKYDARNCNKDEQPPSPIERLKCQFCSGSFFGYRDESRCSIFYVEQGIFGKKMGAGMSYSELFKSEIARLPVDF
jgi:hypothetical protein